MTSLHIDIFCSLEASHRSCPHSRGETYTKIGTPGERLIGEQPKIYPPQSAGRYRRQIRAWWKQVGVGDGAWEPGQAEHVRVRLWRAVVRVKVQI